MQIQRIARSTFAAMMLAMPVGMAAQERVDTATIARIMAESTERSQVMDIMSWLTDVHGPRLTGSPIARAAADWTMESLERWGVENVHLDWWGPFGQGWVVDNFSAMMTTPHPFQLIAYPYWWFCRCRYCPRRPCICKPRSGY